MTQEEKAKAYDEALERARALRQEAIDKEYAIDYVKDYEAIFPELAESEDERIRKWLIELVESQMPKTFIEVKKLDVFAWLEKQKEQKPASISCGHENDKPAEWSVEDEDRIRQIERIAQEAGCTQKLQEEIHDWLKSFFGL